MHRWKSMILALLLSLAAGMQAPAQQAADPTRNITPVTDAMLRNPPPGDWLMAPAGTADCPEIASFRDWLRGLPAEDSLAMHRRRRLSGAVRN